MIKFSSIGSGELGNVLILTDNNWDRWYNRIENILTANDLEDVLNEKNEIKEESQLPQTQSSTTADSKEEKKKEAKAKYVIQCSLSPEDQEYVIRCKKACEMIKMLKNLRKDKENMYTLTEKFSKLKWSNGESIEVFLNTIKNIKLDMERIDGVKSNVMFIDKILNQLPGDMRLTKLQYKMKLNANEAIDFEDFCKNLISNYKDVLEERKEKEDKKKIMNYNSKDGGRWYKNENQAYYSQIKRCNHCGSQFHLVKNCPDLDKKQQSRYGYVKNRLNSKDGYKRIEQPNRIQPSASNDNQNNRNNNGNRRNNIPSTSSESNRNTSQQNKSRSNENRNGSSKLIHNASREPLVEHEEDAYCVFEEDASKDANRFIFDNAASKHIVNELMYFEYYQPFNQLVELNAVGGGKAIGIGTVRVVSRIRGKDIPFKLKNVLFVPDSPVNLFSKLAAQNAGMKFELSEDDLYYYETGFAKNGDKLVNARTRKGTCDLYKMSLFLNIKANAFYVDMDWHKILGHAGIDRIKETSHCVDGMKIKQKINKSNRCNICVIAKGKPRVFNHYLLKSKLVGDVLHSDICDLPSKSIGGSKHFIIFGDEASRYLRIYFLKDLTAKEIENALLKCLAAQNNDIKRLPTRIHFDQGRGYLSKLVAGVLLKHHINNTVSTADMHQQNGFSEKSIQDIMNMTRASLIESKLPDKLWAEAAANSVYIMNRLFKKAIEKTPFEAYFGHKPNVKHMKKFGAKVLVYLPKSKRDSKLSPRAFSGIFVGHSNSTVNYRIVNLDYTDVKLQTNVVFMNDQENGEEESINIKSLNYCLPPELNEGEQDKTDDDDVSEQTQIEKEEFFEPEIELESFLQENKDSDMLENEIEEESNFEHDSEADDEDEFVSKGRANSTADNAGDNESEDANELREISDQSWCPQIYDYLIKTNDLKVPKGVNQMLKNEYKHLWLEAMDSEFLQINYFNTYKLVKREPSMKVLNGHWVFSKKEDKNDYVDDLKARWVIDGSRVQESLYSPVVGLPNLRLILAYAVKNSYEIHTIDVKNAFLNSRITNKVYMHQITLYEDYEHKDYVCELEQSLYGLPESPFNFTETVAENFNQIGLTRSDLDPCIFVNREYRSIVCAHVDDMCVVAPTLELVVKQKEEIGKLFEIKDMGEIKKYLGMEFVYEKENKKLYIKQTSKIAKAILIKDETTKANKIPIQPTVNLYENSPLFKDVRKFQRLIGLINYISLCSRPDVTIYVNQLSKFMIKPTVHAYSELCKVIAYLESTADSALIYEDGGVDDNRVYTYTDAGEQHLVENRGKRVTGVVCTFNKNVIYWSSKTQTVVTGDICEAELYSLNAGLRCALGLRNLLVDLDLNAEADMLMPIFCDNRAAIEISIEGLKKNSKHYNSNLLYLRDYIKRGEIHLEKVPGNNNLADLCTKFVSHTTFKNLVHMMNIKPIENIDEDKRSFGN